MSNTKLSTAERLVWLYGSILFLLGVMLSYTNQAYFDKTYTLEDGVLEWLTMLALATVAVVSLQRLMVFYRDYSAVQAMMVVFVFLAFTFGAGEEISWGQRLFSIESSAFFQTNNAQGETNLHNLVVGETKINKLVFGKLVALFFICYLLVLTPLYYRYLKVRQRVDALAIPIPTRLQWFGYLAVLLSVEGLVQLISLSPKRGELTEFGAALVVMLTVIYPVNQAVFEPSNIKKQPT